MKRLKVIFHVFPKKDTRSPSLSSSGKNVIAIEIGRYSRQFKKPGERICPICKIHVELGEEYHFQNICPAHQEKRCS